MHVHAPDQHLPSPPLRPGNQLVVSRRIGELLRGPAGEGVCTGTEQLHAHGLHDRTNGGQGCLQVVHRLADRPADTRHHLDGVTQQLLVDVRCFTDGREYRGRRIGEVPGLGVNERELPLNPQRGPR
ncbi:Uncharacterised protein [Mycobacteroides abscessus subsp. abscessus]|nr:Uncharacterised protein [Mycobacteroides abscessus subsp. abscessus]